MKNIIITITLFMSVSGFATPLIEAAADNNLVKVNRLIAAGADVNEAEEEDGTTALMLTRNVQIAAALIFAGARVNVQDEEGFSPLCWAVLDGNIQLAAFMIINGADVNHANGVGFSVLMHAVTWAPALIWPMVIFGADVTHVNLQNQTALQLAGNLDQDTQALLQHGIREDTMVRMPTHLQGLRLIFANRFTPWLPLEILSNPQNSDNILSGYFRVFRSAVYATCQTLLLCHRHGQRAGLFSDLPAEIRLHILSFLRIIDVPLPLVNINELCNQNLEVRRVWDYERFAALVALLAAKHVIPKRPNH